MAPLICSIAFLSAKSLGQRTISVKMLGNAFQLRKMLVPDQKRLHLEMLSRVHTFENGTPIVFVPLAQFKSFQTKLCRIRFKKINSSKDKFVTNRISFGMRISFLCTF